VSKVKKTTALSIALLIQLLALTGCVGSGTMVDSRIGGGRNTDEEDMDVNTSEVRWAAVPEI